MADVSSTLPQWSTTASSNSPADNTSVGSGLGDNLRTMQAVVRAYLAHYNSVAIASSGTTDLGANTGLFQEISGTTTITALGTVSAGVWKVVTFTGALTLTHNATSLILPGAANITTAAGDCLMAYSKGSGNWRVPFYQKADGSPTIFISGMTALTAPAQFDELPLYDISVAANRRITLQHMLRVVNDLTADASPVPSTDYLLTYDASTGEAKKALLTSFSATTSVAGVSELADAAETLTGTDLTRTMTPGGFASNALGAANGYYKFPGGFIVQWGTDTLVSSGAEITFPIPFVSSVVAFVCTPVGASAPSINNVIVHTISSLSAFKLWAGVSQDVRWIAFGL